MSRILYTSYYIRREKLISKEKSFCKISHKVAPKSINVRMSLLMTPSSFGALFPFALRTPHSSGHTFGLLLALPSRGDSYLWEDPGLGGIFSNKLCCPLGDLIQSHDCKYSLLNNYSLLVHPALTPPGIPESYRYFKFNVAKTELHLLFSHPILLFFHVVQAKKLRNYP